MFNFSGCLATIYSVSTDNSDPEKLKAEACQANCTMPRVYSGTAMDFCGFVDEDSGQGGGIMFWDMPFSFVTDTIVLPYTIVKQMQKGNISSKEKCKEIKK